MRGEEGAHLHQHDPVDQQVLLVAVPAVSAIPVIVINATIHTIHAIHAIHATIHTIVITTTHTIVITTTHTIVITTTHTIVITTTHTIVITTTIRCSACTGLLLAAAEEPRVVHAHVQRHGPIDHPRHQPSLPRDLLPPLLRLAHRRARLLHAEHARQLHQPHAHVALLLVQPVRAVARAPLQQKLHQTLDVALQGTHAETPLLLHACRLRQERNVFCLHHGDAEHELGQKNPLFRLVVGNVENGDLVGGGDSVVQVHA